jgi:hypothetical protein
VCTCTRVGCVCVVRPVRQAEVVGELVGGDALGADEGGEAVLEGAQEGVVERREA